MRTVAEAAAFPVGANSIYSGAIAATAAPTQPPGAAAFIEC
jgi:hypothetical protein